MQIFNKGSDPKLQIKQLNKNKIANALPLTFSFILISSLVLYGQKILSTRSSPTSKIVIAHEQAEQKIEPENTLDVTALDKKELLKAYNIMDNFIGGELSSVQLIKSINKINSEAKQPNSFYLAINSLLDVKNYQKAADVLDGLDQKELSANSLGFTYAFTLSKIARHLKASTQFEKLLTKQPKHQAALVNLGLLYLQQKHYKKAGKLFKKGLQFASGAHKAKLYAGLADAEFALGAVKSSVKHYKKSIEYRPTHSLTWRKLARAENKVQRPVSIVTLSFQKALALSPKNSRLQEEFARYLFSKIQFTKITKLLRKNLVQSKASIQERLLLIVSYIERERLSNGRKQLNLLLTYASKKQHKEQIKGVDLYLKRHYKDTLAQLKATLKKQRNNDLAYYFIARSYQKLKKPKNALVYLNKIKPSSIYYNLAQYRAGLSYIESSEPQHAEMTFNDLFERLPQNDQITYSVTKLAYAKKHYLVASTALSRALLTAPNKKQYQLMQAKIMWQMGEREAAILSLNKLLSKHSNYKPAIYRLADYLFQQKRIAKSQQIFERLLLLDSDYSNVQLRLARMYFAQYKNKSQAKQLVENYLERTGSDVKARLFYTRLLCATNFTAECKQQIEIVKRFSPANKAVNSIESIYFNNKHNQTNNQ